VKWIIRAAAIVPSNIFVLRKSTAALRENGKLIVNLSVDDLCRLHALKDDGQDCNGAMFDVIDQMMMTLER
jgi:hypothetical protein